MTTRTDLNQTFDEDGKLVAEEVVEVDITEEERRKRITNLARQAVTRLQQIESQASSRTNASNLTQANTQLQALADACADLAKMVRYVIVHDVVPDLLTDDMAAGDLGA